MLTAWRGLAWVVELKYVVFRFAKNDWRWRWDYWKGKRQKQIPTDDNKKSNRTTTTAIATAIEMKFLFCSLLTEGVVYERNQGSDQGEEPGCSDVVGGRAAEGGCLLAGVQLPLRGDAVSAGESAVAGAVEARTY
jgi:hypothetical protein